jgi:hypothetical protein
VEAFTIKGLAVFSGGFQKVAKRHYECAALNYDGKPLRCLTIICLNRNGKLYRILPVVGVFNDKIGQTGQERTNGVVLWKPLIVKGLTVIGQSDTGKGNTLQVQRYSQGKSCYHSYIMTAHL